MKKFLAIALTLVMILGVASSALAFNWDKAADKTDDQKFGYKVEVIKFTRSTGALGSSSYNIDGNATAVNGADVYYAVKLTVPDLATDSDVRLAAKVDVGITALTGATSTTINVAGLDEGVYYLNASTTTFQTIDQYGLAGAVYNVTCLDTDTAKVSAKVYSKNAFPATFTDGDYTIVVNGASVAFSKGTTALATFTRLTSNGKVTAVVDSSATQDVVALYKWLNAGDANVIYDAIKAGTMYMSDDNLRAAWGWSYKNESAATWKANSTPIILDPTIAIPKTGDNTSVIGFAMIMVALVAAVAVKKVNA